MTPYDMLILVNIGSCNGLLPYSTKPLTKHILNIVNKNPLKNIQLTF